MLSPDINGRLVAAAVRGAPPLTKDQARRLAVSLPPCCPTRHVEGARAA